MARILILSAYDAQSHQLWRTGLETFLFRHRPEWEITQVVLPPRFFSWRQRGNSLSFARHPQLQQSYDLIIATSMTDLSALRGLNRRLALSPAIIYFHENQFAFPDQHQAGLIERQMTSIYSALSADWVYFNSHYNRSTFLDGARSLLAKMPDEVPAGLIAEIEKKSALLPVALAEASRKSKASSGGALRIVWNHRWEHDKGPQDLLAILQSLLAAKVDFRLSLFGQQFSKVPPEMTEVISLLEAEDRLDHVGFVDDRETYLDMIAQHHLVLSTAYQEFQGLAVQEAINCGCIPVVPDRLCYSEYIPGKYRYQSLEEATRIITGLAHEREAGRLPLDEYKWEKTGPVWLAKIDQLLS